MHIDREAVYWAIPFSLLFFLGFVFQFFGVISPTRTNFVILAMLVLLILRHKAWSEFGREYVLLIFILYVFFVHPFTSASFAGSATYIYYIICPMVASVAGRLFFRVVSRNYSISKVFSIIIGWLAIQAIVTSVQNIYAEEYAEYSGAVVAVTDVASGTLFLSSDSSLAAICMLLIVATYTLNLSLRVKMSVFILSGLIVANGSSAANQLLLPVVVVLLVSSSLLLSEGINRLSSRIVILLLGVVATFWLYFDVQVYIDIFLEQGLAGFDRRDINVLVSRFTPLGHLFYEDVKVVGDGALTYYNPNTKDWLYNAGFSTLYSLYLDVGLIGLSLFYFFYFQRVNQDTSSTYFTLLYAICFFAYSMFNFVLSDLAYFTVLSFLLRAQRESIVSVCKVVR